MLDRSASTDRRTLAEPQPLLPLQLRGLGLTMNGTALLDNIDLTLTDLQRAMDMLSNEYREIVLLVGLEQMSYKETALVLNIPVGTVMSRLARARKKLRELMTDPTVPTMPAIRRIK